MSRAAHDLDREVNEPDEQSQDRPDQAHGEGEPTHRVSFSLLATTSALPSSDDARPYHSNLTTIRRSLPTLVV